MNRFAVFAGLAIVAGCSDKGDDSAAATCSVVLDATVPAADAQDAYYRAAVEAEFDTPDSTATITLKDASGADVAGSTSMSEDGTIAYFTPSSALSPSTSYSAEISWCDGAASQTVNFTTSSLGESLADPSSLEGQSYVLNLGSARFVKPDGVGELLGQQLQQNILLTVTSADATTLQMIGALSAEGKTTQDFCVPTIDFPPADFSAAPYWEVEAASTSFTVSDITVAIQNLVISGTFAADGSYFGGGVLGGTVDTSTLVNLLDSKDPSAICTLAQSFGAVCEACADDGDPYCLSLLVDQLVAESDPTVGKIVEVTESDCHELCAESYENPKCEKYYKGGK